jgi:hypothetical protein
MMRLRIIEVSKFPNYLHCSKDFSRIWCDSYVIWGKVKKGRLRSMASLTVVFKAEGMRKADLAKLLETELMNEKVGGERSRC